MYISSLSSDALKIILNQRIDLASPYLMEKFGECAQYDKNLISRRDAIWLVDDIVNKHTRPDLITTSLIKNVLESAKTPNGHALYNRAFKLLGDVVEKRPDVANTNLQKNIISACVENTKDGRCSEAVETIGRIIKQNPDLIDIGLMKNMEKIICAGKLDWSVEEKKFREGLKIVDIILDKKPDGVDSMLIENILRTARDEDTLKTVSGFLSKQPRLATIELVNYLKEIHESNNTLKHGFGDPYLELIDDIKAQIKKDRPDLFSAGVQQPTIPQKLIRSAVLTLRKHGFGTA
jgi:hypothetical protein